MSTQNEGVSLEHILHYNKIKEYPNFIDQELSNNLIKYLNTNDGYDENWGSVCFPWHWEKISGGRVGQPKLTNGIENNTILKLKSRIQDVIQSSYSEVDLQGMKGHRQNESCYTEPNAYFNVAAILYLNDDYQGGQFFMPQHNISIKPNANSLYVFEEGENALYGVAEIVSGTRYSITTTWTFAGVDFSMFLWKDRLRERMNREPLDHGDKALAQKDISALEDIVKILETEGIIK